MIRVSRQCKLEFISQMLVLSGLNSFNLGETKLAVKLKEGREKVAELIGAKH